jgi:hypothetical protein
VLASGLGPKLWASFIGLQVILACIACGLAVVSEVFSHNLHAYCLVIIASVVCLVAAVCLTHGVGGRWRNYKTKWNFIQPGVGGAYFVILQAFSWSFFGIAMLVFASNLMYSVCTLYFCGYDMGFVLLEPPSLVSGGLSGLVAEMLLIMSLLVFSEPAIAGKKKLTSKPEQQTTGCLTPPPKITSKAPLPFQGVRARMDDDKWITTSSPTVFGLPIDMASYAFALRARRALISWFCYNLPIVNITIVISLWNVRESMPHCSLAYWMLFYFVYFPTYALGSTKGGPSQTGSRYSPKFLSILHEDLSKYFTFSINRSQKEPFDSESNYVFGYHPHGIIPLGFVLIANACAVLVSLNLTVFCFKLFDLPYFAHTSYITKVWHGLSILDRGESYFQASTRRLSLPASHIAFLSCATLTNGK